MYLMATINRGIVCAYFFQVMMNTKMAKFHIGLIASRWLSTSEIRQIVNKKARYANGFGKMKKALNIALDLGCKRGID